MSPKTSRATWEKVRAEFEAGTYESLKGLAEKYLINPVNLRTKIYREKWTLKRATVEHKIAQKVEEKRVDEVQTYLNSLKSRVKKYTDIIDASIEQSGGKDENGIPLLEPETIDVLTRSEVRLKELGTAGYRIAPISQVDITSGGKSLSMVAAIEKLRAHPDKLIEISDQQIAAISQLEVVP